MQLGICAAVYIWVKSGTKIMTNLLAAKFVVLPLKAESILIYELVTCVIPVWLWSAVQEAYPACIWDIFQSQNLPTASERVSSNRDTS